MKIISHRGYWTNAAEKNDRVAFDRSFSLGYGTETDFRDRNEDLVIAHDMATADAITSEEFFEIFTKYDKDLPLALNIKADGLQRKLAALVNKYEITNCFAFDMSIPDTIGYIDVGIPFFSRQSEYEPQPAFYDKCTGIWLDAFVNRWYDATLITDHLNNKKQVAIVSFELHKRDQNELWTFLKDNDLHTMNDIILCTDIPEDASNFFK